MPSLVAREAFLLAPAIPLVRKCASAFSRSPPHSASARLQSMMPALVLSRSCLTSCGSISVFVSIRNWMFGVRRLLLRRNTGHVDLFARARIGAGRYDRINKLLQHDADRADRIVITRDRVIDNFGVRICVDDCDRRNTE